MVSKDTKKDRNTDKKVDDLRDSTQITFDKMELAINRGFADLKAQIDRLGMVFEFHGHQKIEQSGDVIFRKDVHEQVTGIKLDDNLNPIQPQPQPSQPAKEPEDDPGE